MTCASCSNTITDVLSELQGVSNPAVNLLGNSATVTVDRPELIKTVVDSIEDAGYEAEVISTEPLSSPPRSDAVRPDAEGPQRLTLFVGGMTCVSCSNTVTELASKIPGVSDVAVNLLGKSATAIIDRKELAAQVVETVEDAGVSLRIEGMFCS